MGAFGSCWIQLHLDLPVQNPIHLLKRKVQGVLPRGEADPRRMRLVCMFRNVSSVIFICVSELLVEAGADLGLAAWCNGTSPWHWHKVRSKLGGTSSAVWSPSKACCRQHEDTRAQGTHFLQVNTPGKKKESKCSVWRGCFPPQVGRWGDKRHLLLHVHEPCPAHLAVGFFLQPGSGDFNLPLCMEVIAPIKGNY